MSLATLFTIAPNGNTQRSMAGEGQQTAAEKGTELQNHEATGESTRARRQRHAVPEEGTQSQQAPGREGDWGPRLSGATTFCTAICHTGARICQST